MFLIFLSYLDSPKSAPTGLALRQALQLPVAHGSGLS